MSTKVQKYIDEALSASGFVVLHHRVAQIMRGDLWISGLECAADFATPNWRNRIGYISGLKRLHARLAGIDGAVEILTRSADNLARRVQWVTGFEVLSLEPEAEPKDPHASPTQPNRVIRVSNGDTHAGVLTKETGRNCASCDHLSIAQTCRVAQQSGIGRPLVNEPRRCLAYTPLWDAADSRDGRALWPELTPAIAKAAKGRA